MRNPELATLAYLKLAELSERKKQHLGRDKMLALAGSSACHAGCLAIAEQCRTVIVRQHPRHQLARFSSFADAMRSEDFSSLVKRLQKLCSAEQAEFLAREWGLWSDVPDDASPEDLAALAEQVIARISSAE